METTAQKIDQQLVGQLLPQVSSSSHKGDMGHAYIIGGQVGMLGAVIMSGGAALRTGAGLVTVITDPSHMGSISEAVPELMTQAVDSSSSSINLNKASAVAIGTGLGRKQWGESVFNTSLSAVMAKNLPALVDADGLNCLSQNPQNYTNWVLTPHAQEAARLLNCDVSQIQSDRIGSAQAIVNKYGGVCVLKGEGTLVVQADKAQPSGFQVFICKDGNSGLASAGTGDVLTGVIVGLIAQGLSVFNAAVCGVWLHAKAGDAVSSEISKRGLMATDLGLQVGKLLKKFEK